MHNGVFKKCWSYIHPHSISDAADHSRSDLYRQQRLYTCSSCHSERGTRKQNQDRCYANDELGLYVVVDGMGGSKGGSLASQLTVQVLVRRLSHLIQTRQASRRGLQRPKRLSHAELNATMEAAIGSVRDSMQRVGEARADLKHMGCTFAAAIIEDDRLYFCHTGDTRIYLLNGSLRQLTDDETIAQELLRAGLIAPKELTSSTWRHTVTHCISANNTDAANEGPSKSHWHVVDLHEGNVVLLTTNGLNEAFDRGGMQPRIKKSLKQDNPAQELVAAALSGHNTSCIMCRVSSAYDPERAAGIDSFAAVDRRETNLLEPQR